MLISKQKKRYLAIVSFCILATISAIIVMTSYQIIRQDQSNQIQTETTIVSIKPNRTTTYCPNGLMTLLGDGFCDDEANTENCLYDLGDCCDYSDYSKSRSLCTQCFCQADIPSLTSNLDCETLQVKMVWGSQLGDGVCNSELNNVDNWFDAGDCCYEQPIENCYQSNVFCNPDTLGDGICQDYNNGPLCDYDLGDCCQLPIADRGDECCYCTCIDTSPEVWDYYWVAG